jgi:hypothetical protein
MLKFKEFVQEALDPNFNVKHYGWNKVPNKDHHVVNFMTSNKTPYQLHLHKEGSDEGHHLGFKQIGGTKKSSLERTGKHEVREVIGSVMGLAMQKAKEEPSINKIHYEGADEGLQHTYDTIAKSPSFHRSLEKHGFRYAGKSGRIHTIEKV